MLFLIKLIARVVLGPVAAILLLGVILAAFVFLKFADRAEYTYMVNSQRYVLLERLAKVVALSGKIATIDDGAVRGNPHGISACAFGHISRAIVATEMYNRPSWLINLEFLYADTLVAMGLSRPKLSLGVGQITVATARKALGWAADTAREIFDVKFNELHDDEIVSLLRNPCASVQIAFLIVRQIIEEDPGQNVRQPNLDVVTLRYRGGKEKLIHGFEYRDVVGELIGARFRDVYVFSDHFLRYFPRLNGNRKFPKLAMDYKVLACGFVSGNVKIFYDDPGPGGNRYFPTQGRGAIREHCGNVKAVVTTLQAESPEMKVRLVSELLLAKEMLGELGLAESVGSLPVLENKDVSWAVYEDVGPSCLADAVARGSVKVVSKC